MWLLPPDFPADAFDLPPGTWALPWYADEQHIATLMRLLVAGEARIREWAPLPWAALDEVKPDGPVRSGAALVLHAPADLSTDEIVSRARALPWPYVFWRSSRPVLEGEGAWLEREVKRALLSELHRGLLDPAHPLARYCVERLPLELIASMVGDPVDLLEIAQGAVLHRLEHAKDGLRREDYEHSVKWTAGLQLSAYLRRITPVHRNSASTIIRHGGRSEEDRARFREAAIAIQSVGLGVFIGEDLALGPLARSANDEIVWAGFLRSQQQRLELLTQPNNPFNPTNRRKTTHTQVTLPSVGVLPREHRLEWLPYVAANPGKRYPPRTWKVIEKILLEPRRIAASEELSRARQLISTLNPRSHEERHTQELLFLLMDSTDAYQDSNISQLRSRVAALVDAITIDELHFQLPLYLPSMLDIVIVEHALLLRPQQQALEALEESGDRLPVPPSSTWLGAAWLTAEAEIARARGRSISAHEYFDKASARWAIIGDRAGWVQSRTSSACAAFESGNPMQAAAILDAIVTDFDTVTHQSASATHALLRGLLAFRSGATLGETEAHCQLATERFTSIGDARGKLFAQIVSAEHRLTTGDQTAETMIRSSHDELVTMVDSRGRTYTELVLGDAALLRSSFDESRAAYREALRLAQYTGDDLARSTAHHKLANLETQAHRYDVALVGERQALEIERAAGQTILAEQTERTIAELDLLAASAPASN